MKINFYNLKNKEHKFRRKLLSRLEKTIIKGQFIMGKEVIELEEKLKKITGSNYCISTSSGTDALLISLMAIGVKKGDEVISSPFTFVSTIEVIKLLGAKPVFVDINNKTFNLDENLIEKKISKRTKAIIAVSLFGQSPDFAKINKIAKKKKIFVIEDAAQSFGSKQRNKNSCNLSSIGCTSFFPTKTLGGYGDSGACFTNNKILAERMKEIRSHGQKKKYFYDTIGLNARLDTLQASILIEKLKIFNKEIKLRNKVAQNYNHLIARFKKEIKSPFIEKFNYSVYSQYSILLDKREQTIKNFKMKKIPFAIYYPKPIYYFKPYKKYKSYCPNCEYVCNKIISIPMNPYLKISEQKKIIQNILV